MKQGRLVDIWVNNGCFFYPLVVVCMVGLIPCFFDQVQLLCTLTQWRYGMGDLAAPYVTYGGDGRFYIALVGCMALRGASCRQLITWGGSFCAMSLLVQCCKRLLFPDAMRPMLFMPFSQMQLDGIERLTDMSFPSGHAATIFTMVTLGQLFLKKKSCCLSLGYLLLALMVSYSRLYLYHHFYRDVYVGACIGVVVTVFVHQMIYTLGAPGWIDRSIYCLWRLRHDSHHNPS